MQRLRTQLDVWTSTIQRSVGASAVEIIPQERSEFVLRVKWLDAGVERSHEKLFSQEYVFGRTFGGSPLALSVQKRACDYARDFMREVLNARGLKI